MPDGLGEWDLALNAGGTELEYAFDAPRAAGIRRSCDA